LGSATSGKHREKTSGEGAVVFHRCASPQVSHCQPPTWFSSPGQQVTAFIGVWTNVGIGLVENSIPTPDAEGFPALHLIRKSLSIARVFIALVRGPEVTPSLDVTIFNLMTYDNNDADSCVLKIHYSFELK
jgi:hypothetical protein